MGQDNRLMPLVMVLILGVALQAALIGVECLNQGKPHNVAVRFAKSYFKFDSGMTELICKDRLTVDDQNVVVTYIDAAADKAKMRGFDISYLKSQLYHVDTHTTFNSATEGEVHLTAYRRNAINPVFYWVAKLPFFNLTKEYSVDVRLKVVKEDGKWKVCGSLLDLPDAV